MASGVSNRYLKIEEFLRTRTEEMQEELQREVEKLGLLQDNERVLIRCSFGILGQPKKSAQRTRPPVRSRPLLAHATPQRWQEHGLSLTTLSNLRRSIERLFGAGSEGPYIVELEGMNGADLFRYFVRGGAVGTKTIADLRRFLEQEGLRD